MAGSDPPRCKSIDPAHLRCVDEGDGSISTIAIGQDCSPCAAGFVRALRLQSGGQKAMECVPDCGDGEVENHDGTGCNQVTCTPDDVGNARVHAPNGDCVPPCTDKQTMQFSGTCTTRGGNEVPSDIEAHLGTGLAASICQMVESGRTSSETLGRGSGWYKITARAGLDALAVYCLPGATSIWSYLQDGEVTVDTVIEIGAEVVVDTLCGLASKGVIRAVRVGSAVTPTGLAINAGVIIVCTDVVNDFLYYFIDAGVPTSEDCVKVMPPPSPLMLTGIGALPYWDCPADDVVAIGSIPDVSLKNGASTNIDLSKYFLGVQSYAVRVYTKHLGSGELRNGLLGSSGLDQISGSITGDTLTITAGSSRAFALTLEITDAASGATQLVKVLIGGSGGDGADQDYPHYTGSADAAGQGDDASSDSAGSPPKVSITGGSGVTEGKKVTFTVSASPAPSTPLTVDVSVTSSGDFGVVTGSRQVVIATSGTGSLTITTADDSTDESDGTVTVTVASGTGYTVPETRKSASVAVSDDDNPSAAQPSVSVSGGSGVTEGATATFTVTASPAPSAAKEVNVSVSSVGGYAAAGTRTVTIPTSGSATLSVATIADSVDEADGSVTVTVTAGTGYTVGSSNTATVAVRDDDETTSPVVPQEDVADVSFVAPSGGTSASLNGRGAFLARVKFAPGSPVVPLRLPGACGTVGSVTYRLENFINGEPLGDGLVFDAATRTISGTPTASLNGVYKLIVTDSGGTAGARANKAEFVFRLAIQPNHSASTNTSVDCTSPTPGN
ncbi:putative Ig domain-containing protein [Candidatus Poriferisodalis sp.]|uniref:putative Ig domain-containing protein n=1 Tax=Candidatus Poriferisodalis sp. TaxID=3101277 RepID=UPI003B0172B5